MNTYLICFGLFLLIGGYFLPHLKNKNFSRSLTWVLSVLSVVVSSELTNTQPAWVRMIVIAYLLLLSMKLIVLNETYTGRPGLNFIQWTFFALAWFGMRPAPFEKLGSRRKPAQKIILKGLRSLGLGIILLYASFLFGRGFLSPISIPMILVGLSLLLHFGILAITTGVYRIAGAPVKKLFNAPYKSRSLKEFWGKRWNIAFSEMTALIVYRPLKDNQGKFIALISAFLFSGLLHEIAISGPIKAGYGFPFSYFVIQAILMVGEEKSKFIKWILSNAILSHFWVVACIVLPLPLLFSSAFIAEVLIPLRDVILIYPAI